jgi:hypothetical protein
MPFKYLFIDLWGFSCFSSWGVSSLVLNAAKLYPDNGRCVKAKFFTTEAYTETLRKNTFEMCWIFQKIGTWNLNIGRDM